MRIFLKKLSRQEIQRVKRAADFVGMPWRAICMASCIARQFYRRVETEMRAQAFKVLAKNPLLALVRRKLR